jgi:signal transduction histidine kinase
MIQRKGMSEIRGEKAVNQTFGLQFRCATLYYQVIFAMPLLPTSCLLTMAFHTLVILSRAELIAMKPCCPLLLCSIPSLLARGVMFALLAMLTVAFSYSSAYSFILSSAPSTEHPLSERDSLRALVERSTARQMVDTSTVLVLVRLAWIDFGVRLEQSLWYAHQAQYWAEWLDFKRGLANALTVASANYRLSDQYDSALWASERARRLFVALGDTASSSDALLNIGGTYQSRGEYARALDYYFQALTFYEISRNEEATALVAANIGVAYMLVGQFAAAHSFHERALAIRKRLADRGAAAYSLYFMGNLEQAEHNLEGALRLYTQALKVFDTLHVAHGVALTLGELGRVQMARHRYDEAQTLLLKALLQFQDIADKRGMARALNALGTVRNRSGRPREAVENAMKALNIAEEIGALGEQRDAATVLAEAHESLHQAETSLVWYRRFMRLSDSLFSNDGAQRIAALQLHYATEQKNNEIRRIQEQQRADEAQARTVRNSLLLSMGGLLLILVMAVNRYRLKRRSEAMLQEKNVQLNAQQDELRLQAEEISRTNAVLEAQNEALTRLNNEKNEILGIVAHDLRNPIANIMSLNDMLLMEHAMPMEGSTTSNEQAVVIGSARWMMNGIARSASKMLSMIGHLLDMNAIEQGAVTICLEHVDISTIVGFAVQRFEQKAAQKNITIEAAKAEDSTTPLFVWADPQWLDHVLDNLLSNAIKYSPLGKRVVVRVRAIGEVESQAESQAEGHLSLDIGRSLDEATNVPMTNAQFTNAQATTPPSTTHFIRIEVQDEGPGLSEADKAKLFGKFTRLSARPTGGEHSTGLGLSIVKKLVEAMNGRVWCESELGMGAKFVVEFVRISS